MTARSTRRPDRRPTAALLIIGDEILSGKVADTNGGQLIRLLRDAGIRTCRLTVLPDDVAVIAAELALASAGHDHVFTSGGIGPTHDDRTLEAVSEAFGLPLREDPQLLTLLAGRFGSEGEAFRKMARVPEGSELLPGGRFFYPLLRCRNVFVLPGVPRMLEDKLALLRSLLSGRPPALRRLVLRASETRLAPLLDRIVREHPAVEIGSYPSYDERGSRVEITFEAEEEGEVETALTALRGLLPPGLEER